jgi:hypothetical protein
MSICIKSAVVKLAKPVAFVLFVDEVPLVLVPLVVEFTADTKASLP